jgi:tRNA(Leu) C34 or U34 (ribose-2'-O)-methylase TrmL
MVCTPIVFAKAKEVKKTGMDSLTKSDLFCQTQFDGFLDSTQMEKMLKIDSPCAFNLSAFLFSN